jgi:hypothetical protein
VHYQSGSGEMTDPDFEKIESYDYESSICCPICHEVVVSMNEMDDLTPCEHTLFIATDYGFEFRDDRFNEAMGIQGQSNDEIDIDRNNFDAYTDNIPLRPVVKYAIYTPAPGCLGAYVGFLRPSKPSNVKT